MCLSKSKKENKNKNNNNSDTSPRLSKSWDLMQRMITGLWLSIILRQNSQDTKKRKVKQTRGSQQQDSTSKGQDEKVILPESGSQNFLWELESWGQVEGCMLEVGDSRVCDPCQRCHQKQREKKVRNPLAFTCSCFPDLPFPPKSHAYLGVRGEGKDKCGSL